MSGMLDDFRDYRQLDTPISVTVASGQKLQARGVGQVRMILAGGCSVKLTEVLYVPHLESKLVSVPALTAHGVLVQFDVNGASLMIKVIARIPRIGKLYVWHVGQHALMSHVNASEATNSDSSTWHARLGHVSQAKVKMLVKAVDGVPSIDHSDNVTSVCDGCARGKMVTSSFACQSGSEVKSNSLFELVHSDVMSPLKPKTRGGSQYVVTFIDDFSRYVSVYLLKSKGQVFDKFAEFKKLVEIQHGAKIR